MFDGSVPRMKRLPWRRDARPPLTDGREERRRPAPHELKFGGAADRDQPRTLRGGSVGGSGGTSDATRKVGVTRCEPAEGVPTWSDSVRTARKVTGDSGIASCPQALRRHAWPSGGAGGRWQPGSRGCTWRSPSPRACIGHPGGQVTHPRGAPSGTATSNASTTASAQGRRALRMAEHTYPAGAVAASGRSHVRSVRSKGAPDRLDRLIPRRRARRDPARGGPAGRRPAGATGAGATSRCAPRAPARPGGRGCRRSRRSSAGARPPGR